MEASKKSKPLEVAGQVVGLLASLAVVVYVTGGLVLALRLGFENLPWDAVISQLPREFVVAVGVTSVVVPALVSAALYAAWRLHRGGQHKGPDLPRWDRASKRERWKIFGIALGVAALLISVGVAIELVKDGLRLGVFWALPAWAITTVWVLLVLNLRSRLGAVRSTRHNWNRLSTSAVMGALAALCVLPGAVVAGAAVPLIDVKACMRSGAERTGSLVGETDDKLYFGGGRENSDPRQIIVIPYSRLEAVWLGADATGATCPPATEARDP